MKQIKKRVISKAISIVSFLLLAIINSYGQKPIRLNVNAPYKIDVSKEKNGDVESYKASQIGVSNMNQVVTWKYSVINKKNGGASINKIFILEIPANSNGKTKKVPLNKGEVIDKFILDENTRITPENIKIPSASEIDIQKSTNEPYYFPNDDVYLAVSKSFENIDWIWKEGNREVHRGRFYEFKADRTRSLTVYGVHKSFNIFRTVSKEINVRVLGRNEVINYVLNIPTSTIPDTSSINLSVAVSMNKYKKPFTWNWIINNELIESYSSEIKYKPKTYFTSSEISVYPSFFPSAKEANSLKLSTLPAPSDFRVSIPSKIYTDESLVVRAIATNKYPDTKWIWNVNGKEIASDADSLFIMYPLPNMVVSVRPELNKRVGQTKTVKFENVIVRTVMPKNIDGELRFCGPPIKTQIYSIGSAILGSESTQWVLYENNIKKDSFKKNTFELKPTKSGNYYISPNNRPDLKFNFSIEVVEIPKRSISIEGPAQVCQSRPFELILNGFEGDEKFKWRWEKSQGTNNAERKLIGNGRTLRDSIQSTSTYYVKGEYNGCIIQDNVVRKVFKIDDPLTPQINYQYLDKSKEKARFFVYNYNNKNSYQWSNDRFSTIYSEGESISNYRLKKGVNTIKLRYKDECGIESSTASVSVIRKKFEYFFMNAGIGFSNLTRNSSYSITLGSRSWYFRGKTSMPFIFKGQYQTTVASTALQISEQSRVVNYPRSTGTYYVVNGNNAISRISATTGFIAGSGKVKFYLGGGIGRADLLWGLDIHNYAGNIKEKEVWAKNINLSANGPEFEAGIFLKLGKINFMAGGSIIYDSKISKPYNEFQIGIGFSTK